MTKPYYTLAARNDLAEIVDYASRDKPHAAWTLLDRMEAKCLLIAENSGIGERQPLLGVGVRSNVVGRYVIFYRQLEDRVEILRVLAGDRDITEL
jgi:toxin ParE1/3/4